MIKKINQTDLKNDIITLRAYALNVIGTRWTLSGLTDYLVEDLFKRSYYV